MKNGFLFRRLARIIPCVLPAVGAGRLSIRNKYQIASLRDVFLSANYWRLFDHIQESPKLIVDLGANCGHFTVLMHLLLTEKFGDDKAKYFLVEPVEQLVSSIRASLEEVGIADRARVLNGAVGKSSGAALVDVSRNNMLTTSVIEDGSAGTPVDYLDPIAVLPPGAEIDILKVDIEGSEYDLIESSPDLFRRAKVLAIELHGEQDRQRGILEILSGMGFEARSNVISYGQATMHILVNTSNQQLGQNQ